MLFYLEYFLYIVFLYVYFYAYYTFYTPVNYRIICIQYTVNRSVYVYVSNERKLSITGI